MIKKNCEVCGKEYSVKPGRVNRSKFCSNACRAKVSRRNLSSNLSGKKFGRWSAISQVESSLDGAAWNCVCDCGNKRVVLAQSLVNGSSKSCGCYKLKINSEQASAKFSKPIQPGTRFKRLVVIQQNGRHRGCVTYLCQCDCGNHTTVMSVDLRNGGTTSCGCRLQELKDSMGARSTTHGLSNKPHFSRWRHQVRRESDSGWTIEMNDLLFETQPACVVCGSTKKLTVDHVHPVSRGGKLKPGNAVILCLSCNDKKSYNDISKLPLVWQIKIRFASAQFLVAWNSR